MRDDRRLPNGIFRMLRSGARWPKAGVRGRMTDAIAAARDGGVRTIDGASIRTRRQ